LKKEGPSQKDRRQKEGKKETPMSEEKKKISKKGATKGPNLETEKVKKPLGGKKKKRGTLQKRPCGAGAERRKKRGIREGEIWKGKTRKFSPSAGESKKKSNLVLKAKIGSGLSRSL